MTEEKSENSSPLGAFWLREIFPDPQGIFDVSHPKKIEIKDDCFVALDANVLLLPYNLEQINLPDITRVYSDLVSKDQLVIPAQCAREFAKNRSRKLAELTQYFKKEASLSGPRLKKRVGSLHGDTEYEALLKEAESVAQTVKEFSKKINSLADRISNDLGEDPVSVEYRKIFGGVVINDENDCGLEDDFQKELQERYSKRRPPGYKDKSKDDDGAGDLLIWKSLLGEGKRRNKHCIFVTADVKGDWYVQSDGPFQPRLELIEEYRLSTGKSLYIIPLSQLLKLYGTAEESVEGVRDAEVKRRRRKPPFQKGASELPGLADFQLFRKRRAYLSERLEQLNSQLSQFPPYDGNMSLPWNRAQRAAYDEMNSVREQLSFVDARLERYRLGSDDMFDSD